MSRLKSTVAWLIGHLFFVVLLLALVIYGGTFLVFARAVPAGKSFESGERVLALGFSSFAFATILIVYGFVNFVVWLVSRVKGSKSEAAA